MFKTLTTIHTLCVNMGLPFTLEYYAHNKMWYFAVDLNGAFGNSWLNHNLQKILDAAESWLTRAV